MAKKSKSNKKLKTNTDTQTSSPQETGKQKTVVLPKSTASPKVTKDSVGATARRLKKPRYRSFRLEKRISYNAPKTPGTIATLKESFAFIGKHWQIILGITAVYTALYFILVRGIGGGIDFETLKSDVTGTLGSVLGEGEVSGVTSVFGLVGLLVVNPALSNQQSPMSNYYQTAIFIIFVLAMIWAMRQLHAGQRITVKDAFYKGMYPLVPFILVVLVIGVQMIPVFVANIAIQLVQDVDNPLALSLAEQVLWALFWLLMVASTLYMVSGSIFGLIVVTLADMTPIRALKGAYDIVRFRRLVIMRRFVVLLLLLLIGLVVIMLPVLLWAVQIASVVYTLWSSFTVMVMVVFVYMLYRRMLPRD